MAYKILAVDDETDILEILKYNFKKEGYQIITAPNGLSALKKAETQLPDLIILDIMMENIDGIKVCKELKSNETTKEIPIIFLSAKNEEMDKVLGLEFGADDYVTKPFSVRELLSRIKAVLRRTKKNVPSKKISKNIVHEDLKIDLESKRVYIKDEKIKLTKKEFHLLLLFMENPGKVFTREQIINNVWDDETYIIERAIDVHIRRLRSKLKDYSNLITTYPGMGYGHNI